MIGVIFGILRGILAGHVGWHLEEDHRALSFALLLLEGLEVDEFRDDGGHHFFHHGKGTRPDAQRHDQMDQHRQQERALNGVQREPPVVDLLPIDRHGPPVWGRTGPGGNPCLRLAKRGGSG
ncbi:MAG TPA: hypothetical protein EYM30_00055 [Verrucomicrobia bacterium]|nr:hypothetical protein [Verrucomicrobiota bacterium]